VVNNQLFFTNADTLNNVFTNGVFNTDWSASGGSFGYESSTNRAYVNATSTPSFFGASLFNITDNHFSAKIDIAPINGGSAFTALVIKQDETNYVSMSVDYTNTLRAVSVSSNVPELVAANFPTYNPTTHAYWKISNDNNQFIFWTSADSVTWTQLISFGYFWDTTRITVNFISGFNGSNESSLRRAYISVVNSTVSATPLTTTVRGIDGAAGPAVVTDPNALSAIVSGFGGTQSSFHATGGLPEGGLTDISVTPLVDSARFRYTTINLPTFAGGATVNWVRPYSSAAVSTHYRDGTYWPTVHSVYPEFGELAPTDTNPVALTDVQVEKVPGPYNRLDTNAAFYTKTCEYVPQQANTPSGTAGSTSVTRSKDISLGGDYSGKMVFGGTAVLDGIGNSVYYPYPTKSALTPILYYLSSSEIMRGTVWLSTTRASTQWYAAFVFYDADFTLISQSTFLDPFATPIIKTHPGSGVWQSATVQTPTSVGGAVWVGVVPVVISSGSAETVYMTGHNIQGISPSISSIPTTYSNSRELNIVLKPDRLNYARNSGFTQSIDGWLTGSAGVTTTPSASDSFTRTVTNGWGTADVGGSWTLSGGATSEYNVGSTFTNKADHAINALGVSRNTLLAAPTASQDIRVDIQTLVSAVGNSIYAGVTGRWVDASNFYYGKLELTTSGQILISIYKRVAGVDTALFSPTATGLSASGIHTIRFQIIGTTLRVKVWNTATSEPVSWNATVTDSSFASAGSYGCRSSLDSAYTGGLPTSVFFDNFLVNGTPMSIGWDTTVGFNSLGSMRVDAIAPPSSYSGGSTAKIGAVSTLINNGVHIFPLASDLVIGQVYTISAYVKQGPGCPDVLMDIVDPNYNGTFNISVNNTKNSDPTATIGGWTRVSTTFTVPPDGSSDYGMRFQVLFSDLQAFAPFYFWVDSIMIEKGNLLQPYFDGSFSTADYAYENFTSTNNRSYYYKNFTNKSRRINDIIANYSPLGTTINIQRALTP
jgi:hypothetical protein